MSNVAKQVTTKIDWSKVISSLGLTGQTAALLSAFKKRNDDAKKAVLDLEAQPQSVDFAHYRKVLSNQKVVDEIEKYVKNFQPVKPDVSKVVSNIEIFENTAVENAKLTEKSVTEEIKQLQATLKDIESARPFDQLTVDDVAAASDLDKKVTYMVKNGKWEVPGYKEKFGDLTVM